MNNNFYYRQPFIPNFIDTGLHATTNCPIQQIPESLYRVQRNRDVEFVPKQGDSEPHGQGFKLYRWEFLLNPYEYLVCRMFGEQSERVINAGFATDPLEKVYAVQNFPRYPHGWVTTLKNDSSSELNLFLYLIVKM